MAKLLLAVLLVFCFLALSGMDACMVDSDCVDIIKNPDDVPFYNDPNCVGPSCKCFGGSAASSSAGGDLELAVGEIILEHTNDLGQINASGVEDDLRDLISVYPDFTDDERALAQEELPDYIDTYVEEYDIEVYTPRRAIRQMD